MSDRDAASSDERCPLREAVRVELGPMIDHELRSPLTPLLGYAEILLSGDVGFLTDEQLEMVEAMAAGGHRLHEAIDRLRREAGDFAVASLSPVACGLDTSHVGAGPDPLATSSG